jgi:hypothetical protein
MCHTHTHTHTHIAARTQEDKKRLMEDLEAMELELEVHRADNHRLVSGLV